MELTLEKPIVEKIGKDNLKKFQINDSQYQWNNNITIPLIYFNKDDILELREIISNSNLEKTKETDAAITLIENHLEMIENPCGKIKTVEMGVTANSLECIIDDNIINKIVSEFHSFSGRDIKNILKLCKISKGSKPITIESIKEMKKFIPKFKDESMEKEVENK